MKTFHKLLCMFAALVAAVFQMLGVQSASHGLTAIALATCFYLLVKIDD